MNEMSHVPAWKRLGLNLKYAKEESNSVQLQQFSGGKTSKRSSAKQTSGQGQPAKKRRLLESHSQDETSASLDEGDSSPSLKRKKSVSFTDDTKTEDGDSRITIDFPVGSPSSTPKKLKSEETRQIDGNAEIENTVKSKDESNARKKKLKKTGGSNQSPKTRKSNDSLDYIAQHYSKRSEWKYNKNRDVWIMKNALSTDSIPASLNRALAGYVHGLPKNAGARNRLIEQSREASSHELPVSEKNPLQSLFLDDLDGKSVDANHLEYHTWVKQLSRPQLLLLSLDVEVNRTPANINGVDQISGSERRSPNFSRRKARTTAVVEFSSSSESESEENSDSSLSSDEADDVGERWKPSKTQIWKGHSTSLLSTGKSVSSSSDTSSSSSDRETE